MGDKTVERFVKAHFPASSGKTLKAAHLAINDRLAIHRLLGLTAVRFFHHLVEQVNAQLTDREGTTRRRFHIDDSHLIKEPASILTKMIRESKKRAKKKEAPITYDNFTEHIDDLVRFRIVGVVTSDINALWDHCCVQLRDPSLDPTSLGHWFEWEQLKDTVSGPNKGGERSYKLRLRFRAPGEALRLEVQLVNSNAATWDAANHPFYEVLRARSPKQQGKLKSLIKDWKQASDRQAQADHEICALFERTLAALDRLGLLSKPTGALPAAAAVHETGIRRRHDSRCCGLKLRWAKSIVFVSTVDLLDLRTLCSFVSRLGGPQLPVEAIRDRRAAPESSSWTHIEAGELRGQDQRLRTDIVDLMTARVARGQSPLPPGLAPGQRVTGDSFLGRETFIEELTERLHQGQRLLLVAPRRFGKTSCLTMLSDLLDGCYLPLYVDVGSCKGGTDFVCRLLGELAARRDHGLTIPPALQEPGLDDGARRRRERALARVAARIRDSWRSPLEQLLGALDSHPDRPALLILDELTWMLESIIEQPGGVEECRELIEVLNDQVRPRLRLILSGSVYLDHLLRSRGLPRLAGWSEVQLPPWRDEVPDVIIRALGMGEGLVLGDDAVQQILEQTGAVVPFFLQKLLDEIGAQVPQGKTRDCSIVARAHATLISRRRDNPYLDLQQHLDRYQEYLRTPRARAAAEAILDLASAPDGMDRADAGRAARNRLRSAGRSTTADEVELLLGMLRHDFYLYSPGPDRLAFRCQAIRRWWRGLRGLS